MNMQFFLYTTIFIATFNCSAMRTKPQTALLKAVAHNKSLQGKIEEGWRNQTIIANPNRCDLEECTKKECPASAKLKTRARYHNYLMQDEITIEILFNKPRH